MRGKGIWPQDTTCSDGDRGGDHPPPACRMHSRPAIIRKAERAASPHADFVSLFGRRSIELIRTRPIVQYRTSSHCSLCELFILA
jgi:hypothetical protein